MSQNWSENVVMQIMGHWRFNASTNIYEHMEPIQ